MYLAWLPLKVASITQSLSSLNMKQSPNPSYWYFTSLMSDTEFLMMSPTYSITNSHFWKDLPAKRPNGQDIKAYQGVGIHSSNLEGVQDLPYLWIREGKTMQSLLLNMEYPYFILSINQSPLSSVLAIFLFLFLKLEDPPPVEDWPARCPSPEPMSRPPEIQEEKLVPAPLEFLFLFEVLPPPAYPPTSTTSVLWRAAGLIIDSRSLRPTLLVSSNWATEWPLLIKERDLTFFLLLQY